MTVLGEEILGPEVLGASLMAQCLDGFCWYRILPQRLTSFQATSEAATMDWRVAANGLSHSVDSYRISYSQLAQPLVSLCQLKQMPDYWFNLWQNLWSIYGLIYSLKLSCFHILCKPWTSYKTCPHTSHEPHTRLQIVHRTHICNSGLICKVCSRWLYSRSSLGT